jgi:acetolactate synthase-1/2/3 large subunit
MKDRFVFMDFVTDQEENVYPMMAAGRPHNEMHLGPCTDAVDPDRELS